MAGNLKALLMRLWLAGTGIRSERAAAGGPKGFATFYDDRHTLPVTFPRGIPFFTSIKRYPPFTTDHSRPKPVSARRSGFWISQVDFMGVPT